MNLETMTIEELKEAKRLALQYIEDIEIEVGRRIYREGLKGLIKGNWEGW